MNQDQLQIKISSAVLYVRFPTIFSVNVNNAKAENVSAGTDATLDAKELVLPDKSLKILKLCSIGSHTKKKCSI